VPWQNIHDTLLLLFLNNPHAQSLKLKDSAYSLLKMPPDESDRLHDWLIEAGFVKRSHKEWGAHISKAPGDLVGEYANGDVIRTWELFKYLHPRIDSAGMLEAYDRERQLLSHVLRYEPQGLRVDRSGLTDALYTYQCVLSNVEDDLRTYEGLRGIESFDQRVALAKGLIAGGHVKSLPRTAKGATSTARDVLLGSIVTPELSQLLAYRGQLHTCLSTFLAPWEEQSRSTGRLFPSWNQVRGEDEYGTRSGRFSSSNPNFQNIPKQFKMDPPACYPPLPVLRRLILPDEGGTWVSADFHSQEIRVLAHFAEGKLEEMYRSNPDLDAHTTAAELISARIGRPIDRKATKIIAFSLLYGAGVAKTAERLGTDYLTAQLIKNAYLDVLPGVREFQRDVTKMAARGGAVSWGERVLTAPEGRDYALVNYLIQGSSADLTKQAIIDYEAAPKTSRFLSTVHDEVNISAPTDNLAAEIEHLREVMERDRLSVPMRAEITFGPSWGEQKPWKPQ
jgi:DNA polymerase I-like protein with 3'-5' exonuclease and polymerase domains